MTRLSHNSHLTSYLRRHYGDRPYQCGECDKAFIQKSDFTRHLRIHSVEKPYQCDMCNKAFSHYIVGLSTNKLVSEKDLVIKVTN